MKRIAIFDFDHTLIMGDSFLPFLSYATTKTQTVAAIAEGLMHLTLRRARGEENESRSFIKNYILHRLLAGKKREHLRDAAIKTRLWQTINPPIMNTLRQHAARGDTILIASGGLDLYLPELLHDIPHDALICTDIGVENGIVTGDMIHGNCVRQCKANRVATWLATQDACDETFVYGNYPHDVPMMNLAKYRVIVS